MSDSRKYRTTICACCQQPGQHQGRGLIYACYHRHKKRHNLHHFPLTSRGTPSWLPTGPHGRRQFARYIELVAENASRERIRWELSLNTDRSIQRYEAARRHLATTTQEEPR